MNIHTKWRPPMQFCSAACGILLCLLGDPTAQAQSQPSWGGTVVADRVPFQPEVLHERWADDSNQVELDTMLADDLNVQFASSTTDLVPTGEELAEEIEFPPGARRGLIQRTFVTYTLVPQPEEDSLGWSDLGAGVVMGLPFFQPETPLLITPNFAVNFLDGAENFDLPDKLYSATIEFRHLRKLGAGPWAMDVALTFGHFSDYQGDDADAFIVLGRGIAIYVAQSGVKWLLGAAYVNLGETTVLPVVGMIYDPNPSISYQLVFPKPKVSWLLSGGDPENGDQRWAYIGGEFAGGLWSIEHPSNGEHDRLASSDVRLLAGYERKSLTGLNWYAEFGLVFARKLSFTNPAYDDVDLADTVFARAGVNF